MKQFMSVSALFLSAACLCVHSPSFASSSGPNDVEQGVENMAKGTGKAVQGGVDASAGIIKSTGSGLDKIGQDLKKGWDKMTNSLSGHKHSNTTKSNKHKSKKTNPSGSDPIVTPQVPGASAQMTMPANPSSATGSGRSDIRSQIKSKNANNPNTQSGVNTGSGSATDAGAASGNAAGGADATAAGGTGAGTGAGTDGAVGGGAAF